MRAFAEFIMRGRMQAVAVAVLGVGTLFFAFVSAAAVALVTLRKGPAQGGYVLMWALLPAVVIAAGGSDVGPLATLLGSAGAALVLRQTRSWQLVLLVAVASGLATAALMSTVGGEQLQAIQALLQQFAEQLQAQAPAAQAAQVQVPTTADIAGLIGASNTGTVVVCLLLARWWQALLYNPGGFRAEFHQLRLSPQLTVALLVAVALLLSAGEDFRLWAWMFVLPLTVAGFALVHGAAAQSRLAGQWLWMFYLAWLLLAPVRLVLVLAAIVDSWIDIRKRLSGPQGS